MHIHKILSVIAVTSIFVFSASPLQAAVFGVGEEYTLKRGESVADNLYSAGGSIFVGGNVQGDFFGAGGNILVNGAVRDDVFATGGSVDILGATGGDVRVSGGQVVIGESVGGDVIAVGGTVHVLSNVTISGDLVVAGGRVILDGVVNGDVKVYGGSVALNGSVGGDAVVHISEDVTLGEGVLIGGDLRYTAPTEITIPKSASVSGKVVFIQAPEVKAPVAAAIAVFLSALFLWKLAVTLVASVAAVLLLRRHADAIGRHAVLNFGKTFLTGFIAVIVIPVLGIVLFASVAGGLLGILTFILYGALLLIGKIFAGIIAGTLLARWIKKEIIIDWKWTIVGVLVLELLTLIPILGALPGCIFALVGVGTLLSFVHKQVWLAR